MRYLVLDRNHYTITNPCYELKSIDRHITSKYELLIDKQLKEEKKEEVQFQKTKEPSAGNSILAGLKGGLLNLNKLNKHKVKERSSVCMQIL